MHENPKKGVSYLFAQESCFRFFLKNAFNIISSIDMKKSSGNQWP